MISTTSPLEVPNNFESTPDLRKHHCMQVPVPGGVGWGIKIIHNTSSALLKYNKIHVLFVFIVLLNFVFSILALHTSARYVADQNLAMSALSRLAGSDESLGVSRQMGASHALLLTKALASDVARNDRLPTPAGSGRGASNRGPKHAAPPSPPSCSTRSRRTCRSP